MAASARLLARPLALFLALFLMGWQTGRAQPQDPAATALLPLPQAHALRERATAMKTEAEQRLRRDQAACHKQLLPNACLDAAAAMKHAAVAESRQLDKEGRDAERAHRRLQREASASRHAAEAPRLQAEQAAQLEQAQRAQAARDAEREQRRAKDAADLQRRQVDAQVAETARQRKREQRASQDAERERLRPARLLEEQSRQRAIAEHAAKVDLRIRQSAEAKQRREAEDQARRAAAEAAKKQAGKKPGVLCSLFAGRFCD